MKIEATLFIADKKINDFMKSADLQPDYKVFITDKEIVSFNTKTKVNKKYFSKIIQKSKSQKDFWIPAIQYKGDLYISPEIMEISDGKKILFVGEAS